MGVLDQEGTSLQMCIILHPQHFEHHFKEEAESRLAAGFTKRWSLSWSVSLHWQLEVGRSRWQFYHRKWSCWGDNWTHSGNGRGMVLFCPPQSLELPFEALAVVSLAGKHSCDRKRANAEPLEHHLLNVSWYMLAAWLWVIWKLFMF
jgi:hypothetical protein